MLGDRARQFAWPLLIVALAAAGVLLAVADISMGPRVSVPLTQVIVGASPAPNAPHVQQRLQTVRFDRMRLEDRFAFALPLDGLGPINPYEALRLFLTNGAGLVLIALAALVVSPSRARRAVERLEARQGVPIAVGAGLVVVLLAAAATTLLRFTLLFLAVVPLVLAVALIAAVFGIACISLATGRLLRRGLRMPSVHPLVPALTGALVVFDLAVIPYAGVFALAAVAVAGLGLAIVTRFGSASGWSFGDLTW